MARSTKRRTLSPVFFAVAALIAAAAVGLEFVSRRLAASGSTGLKIGTIETRENDVRRKSQMELGWKDLRASSDVYNNDRVFTGEQSTAEIVLHGGRRLSVKPNSLVVISLPEEAVADDRLSLGWGAFFGRGAETPASVAEKQTPPAATVQVISGSAEILSAESAPQPIAAHEVAAVSSERIVIEPVREPATADAPVFQTVTVASESEIRQEIVFEKPKESPAPAEKTIVEPPPEPPPVAEEPLLPAPEIVAAPEEPPPPPPAPPPPSVLPQKQRPPPPPKPAPVVAESAPPERPLRRESPKPLRTDVKLWLWLGLGANFQYLSQKATDLGTATFQNIQGPTLLAQGGFRGDHWGLDLTYKETPGMMKSSNTVEMRDGSYKWLTLASELLYHGAPSSEWGYRLGIQHHVMPFMERDPLNPIITLKSTSVTMLSLGFDRKFAASDRTWMEWQMRLQHPLLTGTSDGAEFKVSPKLAFDGSIGGVTMIADRSRLGLFWYGQYHQYNWDYRNGSSLSGEQISLYSNIELRLGLEF